MELTLEALTHYWMPLYWLEPCYLKVFNKWVFCFSSSSFFFSFQFIQLQHMYEDIMPCTALSTQREELMFLNWPLEALVDWWINWLKVFYPHWMHGQTGCPLFLLRCVLTSYSHACVCMCVCVRAVPSFRKRSAQTWISFKHLTVSLPHTYFKWKPWF